MSKIQIYYYARKVIRYRLTAKEIENVISHMRKYEILKENCENQQFRRGLQTI